MSGRFRSRAMACNSTATVMARSRLSSTQGPAMRKGRPATRVEQSIMLLLVFLVGHGGADELAEQGCGCIGVDVNSGWNWQPRNHG